MSRGGLPPGRGRAGAGELSLQQSVVLAAVVQRPSHGYEIATRIDRVCGAFVKVHPQMVYVTLDRLEAQELVRSAPQRVESKRVRLVYQATGAGARSYREWLTSELDGDFGQVAVRLAFAGPLGSVAIHTILGHYEQACEREIAELEDLSGEDHTGSIEWLLMDLVRTGRLHRLRGAREWIAQEQLRVSRFEQRQL